MMEVTVKLHHYKEIKPVEESPGVKMHIVAGPDEGARNFIMRVFEIEPNSNTPFHEHSWEHEIFILEGAAAVKSRDGETTLKPGYAIFIPAGEQHSIVNKGKETVRLI